MCTQHSGKHRRDCQEWEEGKDIVEDRRECRCIENPYTTKYCNVRRECEWGIREGGQGREAKPIGRSKAEKGSEQTIAPIPIPSPTPQTIHTETRGSQDLGSFWNWVWHRLEAILTSPGQNCGIKMVFSMKFLGVLVLDIFWVKMGSHSLGHILLLCQTLGPPPHPRRWTTCNWRSCRGAAADPQASSPSGAAASAHQSYKSNKAFGN